MKGDGARELVISRGAQRRASGISRAWLQPPLQSAMTCPPPACHPVQSVQGLACTHHQLGRGRAAQKCWALGCCWCCLPCDQPLPGTAACSGPAEQAGCGWGRGECMARAHQQRRNGSRAPHQPVPQTRKTTTALTLSARHPRRCRTETGRPGGRRSGAQLDRRSESTARRCRPAAAGRRRRSVYVAEGDGGPS